MEIATKQAVLQVAKQGNEQAADTDDVPDEALFLFFLISCQPGGRFSHEGIGSMPAFVPFEEMHGTVWLHYRMTGGRWFAAQYLNSTDRQSVSKFQSEVKGRRKCIPKGKVVFTSVALMRSA